MGIYATYNYYFNEVADPRTKDWPLMSNATGILTIVACYYYFIRKFGPRFMENRKPFDLKPIIQAYNIFQIIGCSILIGRILYIQGHIAYKCEEIDYSTTPEAIRLAEMFWWTFLIKLCELVETVIFVLRKKFNQVSNLHVYHHISTLLYTWIGVKYIAGGMASFPIVLNSFIHVIMYSYYFLSTLGPEWQEKLGKWKNKITIMQMVQFCILLAHTLNGMRSNCNVPNIIGYIFLPNVLLVFYMFYNFYQKSYNKKVK